ncbi:TrbI/VirB10 family protein [Sphingomonas oryzagri]
MADTDQAEAPRRRFWERRGATRAPSPADALGGVNAATLKRQRVILAGGAGVLALVAGWYIFGGNTPHHGKAGTTDKTEIAVSTDDMVNKNLDQKAWMAISSNRMAGQDEKIKSLEGQGQTVDQLRQQVAQLQSQNQATRADGQKVIDAYEKENERLRQAGSANAAGGDPSAAAGPGGGPLPAYGPAGGYNGQAPGAAMAGGPLPDGMDQGGVKVINFGNGGGKGGSKLGSRVTAPEGSPVEVEDSPDYLPPNSYAPATVIVGVDASAGVNSQTDPLPVVLRITGPARSVVQNGRVLTTKITGCVVNGAARGDLSSEKVYVKLAKMTCDQPGGRVAVSEVKGFISFGGKAGVRGTVVSREGSLVGQALIAGIAGGFGRGFAANTNSALEGLQVSTDGKRQEIGAGDLVKGGLGNGVAQAGDEVSKYLIERAEQYQPVVEMPTGINVDIVFLDGAYVRASQ